MNVESLFGIKNKIALVTGSSRGLGLTLARGLAQAGCNVVLNGTDQQKLESARQLLLQEGLNAFVSSFDVTDEQAIVHSVDRIEQSIGTIDILVNNAGIMIRGPLEEFSSSHWQKIIDINLTGAFLVAKAVVKSMIKRNKGKIVNICSVQSELARPTIAAYTASKGGIRNLTRAMATDWGKHNIQVNGIAPGYFKTDLTEALYQDEKFDTWLKSRTPANRWGEPEELLGALIFLSSGASSYVNGHIVYVDGGMTVCV